MSLVSKAVSAMDLIQLAYAACSPPKCRERSTERWTELPDVLLSKGPRQEYDTRGDAKQYEAQTRVTAPFTSRVFMTAASVRCQTLHCM